MRDVKSRDNKESIFRVKQSAHTRDLTTEKQTG